MDLFASDWLTKSSSHTSLVLTNSGLVTTTLGPTIYIKVVGEIVPTGNLIWSKYPL